MSNVKEVTTETFEKEVLSSDVPVLVDFWAEWCGPCKQLAPRVEEAAQQYSEQIKVCKVDIEEHRDLAVQYGIRSIPSLIIFKSGEVSGVQVGALTQEQLGEFIDTEIYVFFAKYKKNLYYQPFLDIFLISIQTFRGIFDTTNELK